MPTPSTNVLRPSTEAENSKEMEISQVKLKPVATTEKSSGLTNMFEEMKKVQLKKVDSRETFSDKRPKLISIIESNFLQNTLAEAIKQRRMELTQNDVEESDEESDWSE